MKVLKNSLLLFTAIILTSFSLYGQKTKLVKHQVEGGISIKIPQDFLQMNESDMWQRVSSYRKSLALFTDLNRLVELGINRSFSVWQEGDYDLMSEVYKSSILELYDEVEFMKEEVITLKNRQFLVFEFISTIYADETDLTLRAPISKYTYLQYTVKEGQTYVFNFSTPSRMKEEWEDTAASIMNSISFR